MNYVDRQSTQTGVALVLSLLILLVLTVIGVAAMNSTIMQERMAGNARTQADVFETASEGVTRSLELFYNEAGNFEFGSNNLSCGQVFGNSLANQNNEAWIYPAGGGWDLTSGTGANPTLEQRMYCCRDWVYDDDVDIWLENPSKLFVLNRSTFMGGTNNSQSLAMREIEVELAEADPDDPTCAICAPGNIGSVVGPNSNALRVDGACGAAVVADSPEDAATFIGGIPENRRGNFDGGIVGGNMSPPWHSPAAIAEFVFWVKLGLGNEVPGLYINGGHTDTGSSSYGTDANPQITYINGDANFGGNISGAGIMIVRGSLDWQGTPDFNGLLLSIGGGFTVGGGGKGGNPSGSMVITTVEPSGSNVHTIANDMYGREVLHYEVARNFSEQEVVMYDPGEYNTSSDVRRATGTGSSGVGAADEVPPRPVLVDNNGRELIHYATGDITQPHRFFDASDGSEVTEVVSMAGNNFEFIDPVDPTNVLATIPYQTNPTRDAYGRLLPEFVLTDNYPDDYGYNPNDWGWDSTIAEAQFQWGTTDFAWSGGGNQNFTYDCRTLQRVKQTMLCEQQLDDLPSNPNDPFWEDPGSELDDYCWHANAGVEGGTGGSADGKYYDDYATPPTSGRPENQMAWHMWNPSCDCLGISVNTDMVVAGWRENLGWRDDEDFQGCDALPSPSGN